MSETAALAIVEVLDRDGQVRHSQRVSAWPLRIGRALDNELSLGDVHVAPHHCVIDVDAEGTGRIRVAQYNVKATGHVAKLRRELGV